MGVEEEVDDRSAVRHHGRSNNTVANVSWGRRAARRRLVETQGPVYSTVKPSLLTAPGTDSVTPPCTISSASLWGSDQDERGLLKVQVSSNL